MNETEIKKKIMEMKPSVLLETAVADMKLCLADERYEIDMLTWYEPAETPNQKCLVCLAGAVLAQTVGFGTSNNISHVFSHLYGFRNQMYAINMFRLGGISEGLRWLYGKYTGEGETMNVNDFMESNPEPFFASMEKVIKRLKEIEAWNVG